MVAILSKMMETSQTFQPRFQWFKVWLPSFTSFGRVRFPAVSRLIPAMLAEDVPRSERKQTNQKSYKKRK